MSAAASTGAVGINSTEVNPFTHTKSAFANLMPGSPGWRLRGFGESAAMAPTLPSTTGESVGSSCGSAVTAFSAGTRPASALPRSLSGAPPPTTFPASSGAIRRVASSELPTKGQVTAQTVSAKLLAELREAQSTSEIEARLIGGLTNLFEELAVDDRRRRAAWEERTERAQREFRASLDADLARGACESRRLLVETKKIAQPCHDLLENLDRQEVPHGLLQILRREAQNAIAGESERLEQALKSQITDAVVTATQAESDRWAEACASQLADGLLREQKARTNLAAQMEDRLSKAEKAQATLEAGENKVYGRLRDLHEAHATLQAALDKYADRWERAWREEAEARLQGDNDTTQRLEVMVRAGEAQSRALEASLRRTASEAQRRVAASERGVGELRAQAELEASARQESDERLAAELLRLRNDLQSEVGAQSNTNQQLASGFEHLRSLTSQVINLLGEKPPGPPSPHFGVNPDPAADTSAHTRPANYADGSVGGSASVVGAGSANLRFGGGGHAAQVGESSAAAANSAVPKPGGGPEAFPTSAPGSPVLASGELGDGSVGKFPTGTPTWRMS
eukprot:TRINITY_DN4482_c0_g1_i1.p1 TRINITY_DN4482_c0_g1~~TRINITY_DN4482_c0_g1_i1.p1  ORF type:complete len:572 (+),score=110.22 TRINITY_DN4482_c0_g1_i1:113-1828(+)